MLPSLPPIAYINNLSQEQKKNSGYIDDPASGFFGLGFFLNLLTDDDQ